MASRGRRGVDPPEADSQGPSASSAQPAAHSAPVLAQQHHAMAGAQAQGAGTLFTEPVLVIQQRTSLSDVNDDYVIYNRQGVPIGAVRAAGGAVGSMAKKMIRSKTNFGQQMTLRFEIVDASGNVVLTVTRPAKAFVKSRFVVQDAMGNEIGQLAQQSTIGKLRFGLESGGNQWGAISMVSDKATRTWWFTIQDHTGAEIARVTKEKQNLAKALLATSGTYTVEIHRPLDEPLRSLVVSSALSVDTVLKGGG